MRLVIYNVLGERVRVLVDAEKTASTHTAIWNGRNDAGLRVAAGAYLYRLEFGEQVLTRKLVLLP